ncbi:MAG TPA: chemotaxis protein CheD [Thermoanaerobaculia bacterium]|nr:chemotaxis protein CheD [Thermoanaerobaculia bacterium]
MTLYPLSGFPPSPNGRPTAFLQAGHMIVSAKPLAVTTILGSCVSVCLIDIRAGIGGINHYLLPYTAPDGGAGARYGNTAIRQLVDEMSAAGASRARLVASVFGGAMMLNTPPDRTRAPLGEQNADLAASLLQELGIAIEQFDVGGDRGRKLIFHTDTGYATAKPISSS